MSFRISFDEAVLDRWKRLDFELQEMALDAFEEAIDSPPQPSSGPDPAGVETRIVIHRQASPGVAQVLNLRIGWWFEAQVAAVVELRLERSLERFGDTYANEP